MSKMLASSWQALAKIRSHRLAPPRASILALRNSVHFAVSREDREQEKTQKETCLYICLQSDCRNCSRSKLGSTPCLYGVWSLCSKGSDKCNAYFVQLTDRSLSGLRSSSTPRYYLSEQILPSEMKYDALIRKAIRQRSN